MHLNKFLWLDVSTRNVNHDLYYTDARIIIYMYYYYDLGLYSQILHTKAQGRQSCLKTEGVVGSSLKTGSVV